MLTALSAIKCQSFIGFIEESSTEDINWLYPFTKCKRNSKFCARFRKIHSSFYLIKVKWTILELSLKVEIYFEE